jgi:hypothetical protein
MTHASKLRYLRLSMRNCEDELEALVERLTQLLRREPNPTTREKFSDLIAIANTTTKDIRAYSRSLFTKTL